MVVMYANISWGKGMKVVCLDNLSTGSEENIPPLKFIHNQIVSNENKNKVMSKWLELEEELMKDVNFRTQGKIYCRNLFMEAVKKEYK